MLALDVGVPGTDPMWHMYHWRGSVGTRGTARPGPVGRRVYRPAPGRGNGRTPGRGPVTLWGLAETDRKPNRRLKTEGPESAVARCGLLVWLWIRVTQYVRKNVTTKRPRPGVAEVRRTT